MVELGILVWFNKFVISFSTLLLKTIPPMIRRHVIVVSLMWKIGESWNGGGWGEVGEYCLWSGKMTCIIQVVHCCVVCF